MRLVAAQGFWVLEAVPEQHWAGPGSLKGDGKGVESELYAWMW